VLAIETSAAPDSALQPQARSRRPAGRHEPDDLGTAPPLLQVRPLPLGAPPLMPTNEDNEYEVNSKIEAKMKTEMRWRRRQR
jgi:hypothetical protein